MDKKKQSFKERYIEHMAFNPETDLIDILEEYFDISTYDHDISKKLIDRMIKICWVILNDRTFDFIKDQKDYEEYILIMNLPYFKDRTEWGTSIRGAWFNDKEQIKKDIEEIEKLYNPKIRTIGDIVTRISMFSSADVQPDTIKMNISTSKAILESLVDFEGFLLDAKEIDKVMGLKVEIDEELEDGHVYLYDSKQGSKQ